MPYSPPWEEQEEDGVIQQDRDRAEDYGWSDIFIGKKSGQIPPMGGESKTWFEAPGLVVGSVRDGGTAYDPGDGTNTDSAKSWDLEFELDAGLSQEMDPCGDSINTGGETMIGGYDEFTNAHFIVCVNEELSDSLTKGDIGALTDRKSVV